MKAIKLPFQFINGRLATTTSPEVAAKQKIIDVLTTGKFERVMRHNYGVGLQELVFEPVDELAFVDFKTDALHTMAETLSRVEVVDLVIAPSNSTRYYGADETTVVVNVVYRLPLGALKVLSFNLAIPGLLNEDTPI
jgi:phage baseplate assembly protein W